jgi:hypothetical protein
MTRRVSRLFYPIPFSSENELVSALQTVRGADCFPGSMPPPSCLTGFITPRTFPPPVKNNSVDRRTQTSRFT